jgi:methionyl-tRNA formyltransferase
MGTPIFAIPTLEKLIFDPEIKILSIYTKEPKISHRGQKIQNSPIHNLALSHNLDINYPKTLKNAYEKEKFINYQADMAIVVAYGLILPTEIIDGTKLGCFNIHPSILPRWRGAAPIQRAIMAGDKQTAISIIKMNEGLDSGNIIYMKKFSLSENDYCDELSDKISQDSADILLKTIKNIYKGDFLEKKQSEDGVIYAKKIEKSEFQIDFLEDVNIICNKIRGLKGCGCSYFLLNDERIKIHQTEMVNDDFYCDNFGKITIEKDILKIRCKNGYILPKILQRAGKKPVNVKEFIGSMKNYTIPNL